ncbi:hypothetical protein F4782DRAFT_480934 [Xylaria castorea]|nr:hypothetical protein F4782DRAFT_480934 [Xylaria castorea]
MLSIISTDAKALATRSASSTPTPKNTQYPIVPSFKDWRLPHGKLPLGWRPHPSDQQHTAPLRTAKVLNRCYFTNFLVLTKKVDVIPSEKSECFQSNFMRDYLTRPSQSSTRAIHDESNIAWLRADVHKLFDRRVFTIAPKPLLAPLPSTASSTSTASPISTTEPQS